jgi:hypothetical protein
VVGGKLVNSISIEGKLVILAKMKGKLVNCRKHYSLTVYHSKYSIKLSFRRPTRRC